jgi:hypothetical protein
MTVTLADALPGYSKRKIALIEAGLCIRCGERDSGGYRMCRPCRTDLADIKAGRPKPKKRGRPKTKPDPPPRPPGRPKRKKPGPTKKLRGYWPEIHGRV